MERHDNHTNAEPNWYLYGPFGSFVQLQCMHWAQTRWLQHYLCWTALDIARVPAALTYTLTANAAPAYNDWNASGAARLPNNTLTT